MEERLFRVYGLVNFCGSMDESYLACTARNCALYVFEDASGTLWLGHWQEARWPFDHPEIPESRILLPPGAVSLRPSGVMYDTTPLAAPLNEWVAQVHHFEDLPRQVTQQRR